jgi:hypothetical protein
MEDMRHFYLKTVPIIIIMIAFLSYGCGSNSMLGGNALDAVGKASAGDGALTGDGMTEGGYFQTSGGVGEPGFEDVYTPVDIPVNIAKCEKTYELVHPNVMAKLRDHNPAQRISDMEYGEAEGPEGKDASAMSFEDQDTAAAPAVASYAKISAPGGTFENDSDDLVVHVANPKTSQEMISRVQQNGSLPEMRIPKTNAEEPIIIRLYEDEEEDPLETMVLIQNENGEIECYIVEDKDIVEDDMFLSTGRILGS